ncbi:MAG: MFS transporter, partial [Stellaceae bacterium]
AVINAVAAIPLFFVRDLGRGFGRGPRANPFAVFMKAPVIVLAVGLFGLYETATLALLPIWGVRSGLDARVSASTLTAIYFGSIALQIPIGWLSDRVARLTVLRLCGLAGLVGAALVPLVSSGASRPGPSLFLLLFFWGGLASGLYPVALSIVGDRFRGAALVRANAALIMSYGLGSLVGPIIGGAAMDLWNPHGLLAVFALVFALFLAATLLGERPIEAA